MAVRGKQAQPGFGRPKGRSWPPPPPSPPHATIPKDRVAVLLQVLLLQVLLLQVLLLRSPRSYPSA